MGHAIIAVLLLICSNIAVGRELAGPPAFNDLPAFKLENKNGGGEVDSTKVDQPMLVEFYFNTCPACNDNADKVELIAKEFITKAVVVDFGYDCKDTSYTSWIGKHHPKHPVLYGCDSPLFDAIPVSAYPTTLIVDKNKKIVKKYVGTWSNSQFNEIRRIMGTLSKK